MQKRWQLIEHPPCLGAIRISDAGNDGPVNDVNGVYCPVEERNGKKAWERPGPYYGELFWESSGTPQWMLRVSGLWVYSNLNGLTKPDPDTWVPEFAPPDLPPVITVVEDTVIRDLTPTGGGKFTRERDLSNGCIGYRRKLASELTFTGDDYKFFLTYEKSRTRRCHEFTIRRQWKCGGKWETVWIGSMSAGMGRWNRSACTWKVKPEPSDDYTCILKALKKPVNVLTIPSQSVIFKPSCLEFGVVITRFNIGGSCTWQGVYPSGVDTDPTFTLADTHMLDIFTQVKVYWREVAETDCESGSPVTPNGTGWTLLVNDCGGTGTATFWRAPLITYDFPNTSTNPNNCPQESNRVIVWPSGTLPIISGGCGNTTLANVYLCVPGYIQCDSVESVTYSRARLFEDAVNKILESIGCPNAETARSDFFEWDAPGTADGYTAGTNYVTGATNQVDRLAVVQRSDAIDPLATNPARIGDMTLGEVVDLFAKAFRVYWDLEGGSIRFEHIKHWNATSAVEALTTVAESGLYTHLTTEIPTRERLTFRDSFLDDFIGVDVEYDSPCASGDENSLKEYNVGFMTDVYNCQLNGASLDKKGFLLLATEIQGTNTYVINDSGAYTNALVPNAPVSTANIQRDYWNHDRFLLEGSVNAVDTVFDDIQPNVEQKEVTVEMCCDVFDFDPRRRVISNLGKTLGTVGNPKAAVVQREELTESDECVRLTIRYGY